MQAIITIQLKDKTILQAYPDFNKAMDYYNFYCKEHKKDFVQITLEGAKKITYSKKSEFMKYTPNGFLINQKGELN